MENLSLGLTLMGIGMLTVFVILLMVIYLSNALIAIVNRVCPEEEQPKKKAPVAAKPQTVDANVMAVIKATVNQLTGGKGVVTNVEKL